VLLIRRINECLNVQEQGNCFLYAKKMYTNNKPQYIKSIIHVSKTRIIIQYKNVDT
jgi:hypothetical protein